MVSIEFDSSHIDRFIKIVYGTKNELIDSDSYLRKFIEFNGTDGCINIIKNKYELIYFRFVNEKWTFYGDRKFLPKKWQLKLFQPILVNLDKNLAYLGAYFNGNLRIIYTEDIDGRISTMYPCDYCVANFKNNTQTNIINGYYYQKPLEYKDILMITNKGIVYFNSSSCIDMIISLLKLNLVGIETSSVISVLPKNIMDIIIKDFDSRKNSLLLNKPNNLYSNIFNQIKINDNDFYCKKITIFNNKIIEILALNCAPNYQSIINFVDNLKNDFITELQQLYRWFRKHPVEKKLVFSTYNDHGYTVLLNKMHQKISSLEDEKILNKFWIPQKKIIDMFNENIDVYNNIGFTMDLVSAIKYRSQFANIVYHIFTLSNKKIEKNNFYPFKIFSPYLFILEHILNQ